jgi:transcriptional regulator NrdR family protein
MVVKKNGRKSTFDRDKLAKSVFIALKKDQLIPKQQKNLLVKSQDL